MTPRPAEAGKNAAAPPAGEPLAIVCGGGVLPALVARKVAESGRPVVLFPLRGFADPAFVSSYRHHWMALASYGRFCRLMRAEGCRDLVVIGALVRPALSELRLDWGTLRVLPRIARAFRGGDDHLLTGIAEFLEDDGFRLVGAHQVCPDILIGAGPLGAKAPSARDAEDIAIGMRLLAATSPFDVGQAVVVADRHVLAVEGIEGTDAMLARVAALRAEGRIRAPQGRGVLVKAPKLSQDRRLDLPTIGPRTVEGVAAAGLAGLAVAAGGVILAEPQEAARKADAAKIFVVGTEGAA